MTIFMVSSLAACASMTTGPTKKISVNTSPVEGASCQLSNDDGKWSILQTPGDVIVNRDNSAMVISCTKDDMTGESKVNYSPELTAFGNVVMIGGFVGAIIDAKTGAAFSYPDNVVVTLAESKQKATAMHSKPETIESATLSPSQEQPL